MKPVIPFLQRLRQGPLLADGAMGTMLHQAGAHLDACFDALNVTAPESVIHVHRAFAEAGAELLETNTFSANRFKLAAHGWSDEVAAIHEAAVRLARSVAISGNRPVYVGGAAGPPGARLGSSGGGHADRAFEARCDRI